MAINQKALLTRSAYNGALKGNKLAGMQESVAGHIHLLACSAANICMTVGADGKPCNDVRLFDNLLDQISSVYAGQFKAWARHYFPITTDAKTGKYRISKTAVEKRTKAKVDVWDLKGAMKNDFKKFTDARRDAMKASPKKAYTIDHFKSFLETAIKKNQIAGKKLNKEAKDAIKECYDYYVLGIEE